MMDLNHSDGGKTYVETMFANEYLEKKEKSLSKIKIVACYNLFI